MKMRDSLPTLSRGAHPEGSGFACAMEYLSVIAGEEWSDRPSCTHGALRRVAQQVNDLLDNTNRHLLMPLLCRLLGANVGDEDPWHPVTRALEACRVNYVALFSPEDALAYLSGMLDVYDRAARRNETPVITEEQMAHAREVVRATA